MNKLFVSCLFLALGLCYSLAIPNRACTAPSPAPTYVDSQYYKLALQNEDDPDKLKAALGEILAEGKTVVYDYSCLWQILSETDVDPNNSDNVMLIYSNRSFPKYLKDNGTETEAWNREHVWPKSHGFPDDDEVAYTDLHHLRPCDKRVNNARSDKDFKNGGTQFCADPWGATSGCKVYGYQTTSTFEVPDIHKGDVARMIFYMEMRYQSNPKLEIVNSGTYRLSSPQLGYLCDLIDWARNDPVDSFELKRNNVIYSYQLNRNPFIDHPEWVEAIYGESDC